MTSKKVIGLTIFFTGLIMAGVVLVHAAFYAPEDDSGGTLTATATEASTSTPGTSEKTPPRPDYPSRLEIPALGIDARVQDVGLSAKGNMGIPSNFTDVAWYRQGTIPGKVGSAVIDGHVDNGLALPGVFKHLDEVNIGDEIDILRNDGTTLHFTVTDVKTYPYNDPPSSDIFYSSDNKAHLNLITCTGNWVQGGHTYNERLVVYATLES